MAAKAPPRQIVQRYALGSNRFRDDILPGFSTDRAAWTMAEDVAEKHIAAWLFELTGQPVPGFEPATLVRVEGIARRNPHPEGSFTWQVEGCALLIAQGLDPAGLQVYLSDYRTSEGRIDRLRSASSQRAALICAEMEAGTPPQVAFERHKLPSIHRRASVTNPRLSGDDDAAALAFYRSLVAAGEVEP